MNMFKNEHKQNFINKTTYEITTANFLKTTWYIHMNKTSERWHVESWHKNLKAYEWK